MASFNRDGYIRVFTFAATVWCNSQPRTKQHKEASAIMDMCEEVLGQGVVDRPDRP